MKKAFKIIIPMLLSLVVLGSLAWYFLIYDSAFTQELLLNHARYLEDRGNHTAAVWVYDLAYSQSGEDGNVAIELAQQYKSAGNYTKAEYTLSKAIADGGSVELYTELCKTYVEQDKLLDAVRMLDKIADPTLKDQLQSLRPSAPVFSKAAGFYNEYITLEFTADAGTLYVTTDGTYPSVQAEPYGEAYTLPAGETTVYALVVGDNGLVSPVTVGTYTVVGVIEPVTFQDPAVEAVVRQLLNYGEHTIIHTNDLWTITEFTVPEEAESYADLAGMINLKTLSIPNARSSSFTFLSSLTSLQSLEISGITLDYETLGDIAAPTGLRNLSLTNCGISSLVPLAALQQLVTLELDHNSIRSLAPLVNMLQLEELSISYNAVNDIDVLTGLPKLRTLDLSYNSLSSAAAIGSCIFLEELDLTHNKLSDISVVGNLKHLTHFAAAENTIKNVASLSGCTLLTELDISGNVIEDISALSALTELMHLNFSNNAVTALPAWPVDCALVSIDGSYNLIDSVEPLTDLYELNLVNLDYNPELESIEALEGCPALVQVDVYGTRVTEVSALTARSIVVHFDPTSISIEGYEDADE